MVDFFQQGTKPKLCVPICGGTAKARLDEFAFAQQTGADILEWRYDLCRDMQPVSEAWDAVAGPVFSAVEALHVPLLFTMRSRAEGGEGGRFVYEGGLPPEKDGEMAVAHLEYLAKEGLAKLWQRPEKAVLYVDVEFSWSECLRRRAFAAAQSCGARVVLSSHDFSATPPSEAITAKLVAMHAFGAEYPGVQTVPKLAVMPQCFEDALRLMACVHGFVEETKAPVIAMSMGKTGAITRIAAESFGSVLTFGAGLGQSAPGQLPAAELRRMLDALHVTE